MRRWMRGLAVGGGLLLATLAASAGQTGASTTNQVDTGLQVYQTSCANCHGPSLTDGSQGPPLIRPDFAQKWGGNVATLRPYIHKNMPWPLGGVLTQEEALNVAHYLMARNGVGPDGFAEPAFRDLWTVADQPVAAQQTRRSWLWGPTDNARVAWEEYTPADGPRRRRLVQYFDKTRMEITRYDDPAYPRNHPDFVTNGLLATELLTGLQQDGDNTFVLRRPAENPIAGDSDDAGGPTYRTFGVRRAQEAGAARQGNVLETIDRAGTVGQNGALGNYTEYAYFVPETKRNIARVFWDYLQSGGPVIRDGQIVEGRLFDPWYEAVGFPITEPYWAQVKVTRDGRATVVPMLIQCFERRCLTFDPSNKPGFEVEMGNIGQHYHAWRYGG